MDFFALTIILLFVFTCWGLLALCQNLMDSEFYGGKRWLIFSILP
jgi:hypothetical protein